jgi:hypothetical protein
MIREIEHKPNRHPNQEEKSMTATNNQEKKQEERVACIASGYEWLCPNCDGINEVGVWEEEVSCDWCEKAFRLLEPEHAF